MLINKKSVLIALPIILITLVGVNFYSQSYTSGPPSGKTGSPGDNGTTCTSCHKGTPMAIVTNQTLKISTTVPSEGYKPDSIYQVTITAMGPNPGNPAANKYGFQACVEKLSTKTKSGTIIATNTTETQLNGKYINHTSSGVNVTNDSKTWTFNWKAPAAGNGAVKVYAATNITNGNSNDDGGDLNILASSDSLKEKVAIVNGFNAKNISIGIYPNPATEQVTINLPSNLGTITINVYNQAGILVHTQANAEGKVILNTSEWASGSYIISTKGAYTAYSKLMVR